MFPCHPPSFNLETAPSLDHSCCFSLLQICLHCLLLSLNSRMETAPSFAPELLFFLMTTFYALPSFVTESPNGNCTLPCQEFPLLCLTTFLGFCQSYDRFYFLLGKLACPSGPHVNGNLFST